MKLYFTKKLIIITLILALLSGLVSGCLRSDSGTVSNGPGETTDTGNGKDKEKPPLDLVQCPLSGDMVPKGTTDRRPLAIMIENAPAARPQSGLDKADIVYEMLAEGGLTRFLAVYLHNDTESVGPVRSARPYFIERMFEYNAIYAYCGGSPDALKIVKGEKIAALDEFSVGKKAYRRDKSRKAPHNLYADTLKLRQVAAAKGYEKNVKLPEFSFLDKGEENSGGITSENIIIRYPTKYSIVKWDFDIANGLYKRSEGGSIHRDAQTGKQLAASNIIVQYVKTSIIDKEGRLEFSMTGRGKAVMFTGGKTYSGTWRKASKREQTYFYGENGEVLKLNPGQTWIEVVSNNTKVEY